MAGLSYTVENWKWFKVALNAISVKKKQKNIECLIFASENNDLLHNLWYKTVKGHSQISQILFFFRNDFLVLCYILWDFCNVDCIILMLVCNPKGVLFFLYISTGHILWADNSSIHNIAFSCESHVIGIRSNYLKLKTI